MARPRRRLGNLPAEATSFVGRRAELAEIRKRLGSARVVSLVGPGGVGKTRLAMRTAADLGRGFRDGAWLVELADVREAGLVPDAVMAALDLRAQAAAEPLPVLLGHLRERELLLVIDNCEHLAAAAAELVDEVVAAAPEVRVLLTSREPLLAAGEHVVPIPPLELPSAHASEPVSRLQQNEAVMLFVERAAAAGGSFTLTAANGRAVADLCRRLDGLPLALELAAVRTRVLSVEQILERLTDRFHLLVGGGRAALPRHQTLETAIDWSYGLLSDTERLLLARMCAFAGRFTLRDVEEVCVDSGSALDLVSSLVDKSLVIKEEAAGVACFRLHETMREYALRKLMARGELDAVLRRCTDYYATSFQAVALDARFRLLEWLPWVELEIDNIRAVLRRCIAEDDAAPGIVLATSLSWYWITRATSEGVRWLDELLLLGDADPDTMAWSCFLRGFLAVLRGDWATARPSLARAVAIARASDLPIQLVNSLTMSSIAAILAGERDESRRLLDEAAAVASGLDDLPSHVAVLQARSLDGMFNADADAVRAAAAEGLRLSQKTGDLYAQHMMLLNLGGAAFLAGEMAESKGHYEAALRIAFDVDDRIGESYMLAALGFHAALGGRPRVAAQLLGASETIRLGAGATVMNMLAPFIAQAELTAAGALGDATFRSEMEIGRGLAREAAVRLALGEPKAVDLPARRNGAPELGGRQLEVARLVAEGLSNRQIAARLFLSERTVDSHVRSILDKLGFNSRAQIAGWIASQPG
jgi:predicted ATPase/DNA-binding CsgD family transcriptional regulator